MNEFLIRNIQADDHAAVIAVVNDWWSGRSMADMLPKLFFQHFQETSFIGEYLGQMVAFLVGFHSQTIDNESYIHFAGVHPDFRNRGIARKMYKRFFEVAKSHNRSVVRCITSPINKSSVKFHQRMGFRIQDSDKRIDDICVWENYDGVGGDRVLFYKTLHSV